MTKNERMLRIKYAEVLSELNKERLCPLLLEIDIAINNSKDEAERGRLQKRFDQVNGDIQRVNDRINQLTSESRMAKASLHIVKKTK